MLGGHKSFIRAQEPFTTWDNASIQTQAYRPTPGRRSVHRVTNYRLDITSQIALNIRHKDINHEISLHSTY